MEQQGNNRACYNSCFHPDDDALQSSYDWFASRIPSNFIHFFTVFPPALAFGRDIFFKRGSRTREHSYVEILTAQERVLARERIVSAYTAVRATFARLVVHFINARRLYGSRRLDNPATITRWSAITTARLIILSSLLRDACKKLSPSLSLRSCELIPRNSRRWQMIVLRFREDRGKWRSNENGGCWGAT